jgi:phage host-nuclease inhibitor protein Gam
MDKCEKAKRQLGPSGYVNKAALKAENTELQRTYDQLLQSHIRVCTEIAEQGDEIAATRQEYEARLAVFGAEIAKLQAEIAALTSEVTRLQLKYEHDIKKDQK